MFDMAQLAPMVRCFIVECCNSWRSTSAYGYRYTFLHAAHGPKSQRWAARQRPTTQVSFWSGRGEGRGETGQLCASSRRLCTQYAQVTVMGERGETGQLCTGAHRFHTQYVPLAVVKVRLIMRSVIFSMLMNLFLIYALLMSYSLTLYIYIPRIWQIALW
jgi:hypothetical protein